MEALEAQGEALEARGEALEAQGEALEVQGEVVGLLVHVTVEGGARKDGWRLAAAGGASGGDGGVVPRDMIH